MNFFFNFKLSTASLLALVLIVGACKRNKDGDPQPNADDTGQLASHSQDAALFQQETDLALADANQVLLGSFNFNGGRLAAGSCATPTIDSTSTNANGKKVFYLNFNQTQPCNGRARVGQVSVQLYSGNRWSDAGAVALVGYNNLKVTRVINSVTRTVTLNGWHVVTNINGGHVLNMASGAPAISHRVRGSVEANFDNGGTRSWQVYRLRSFTRPGNAFTVSVAGDTTIDNRAVAARGTNRFNRPFVTSISQPVLANETCGWTKPVGGTLLHTLSNPSVSLDITYGTDAQGNSASNCPGYYKVRFTGPRGGQYQYVYAY